MLAADSVDAVRHRLRRRRVREVGQPARRTGAAAKRLRQRPAIFVDPTNKKGRQGRAHQSDRALHHVRRRQRRESARLEHAVVPALHRPEELRQCRRPRRIRSSASATGSSTGRTTASTSPTRRRSSTSSRRRQRDNLDLHKLEYTALPLSIHTAIRQRAQRKRRQPAGVSPIAPRGNRFYARRIMRRAYARSLGFLVRVRRSPDAAARAPQSHRCRPSWASLDVRFVDGAPSLETLINGDPARYRFAVLSGVLDRQWSVGYIGLYIRHDDAVYSATGRCALARGARYARIRRRTAQDAGLAAGKPLHARRRRNLSERTARSRLRSRPIPATRSSRSTKRRRRSVGRISGVFTRRATPISKARAARVSEASRRFRSARASRISAATWEPAITPISGGRLNIADVNSFDTQNRAAVSQGDSLSRSFSSIRKRAGPSLGASIDEAIVLCADGRAVGRAAVVLIAGCGGGTGPRRSGSRNAAAADADAARRAGSTSIITARFYAYALPLTKQIEAAADAAGMAGLRPSAADCGRSVRQRRARELEEHSLLSAADRFVRRVAREADTPLTPAITEIGVSGADLVDIEYDPNAKPLAAQQPRRARSPSCAAPISKIERRRGHDSSSARRARRRPDSRRWSRRASTSMPRCTSMPSSSATQRSRLFKVGFPYAKPPGSIGIELGASRLRRLEPMAADGAGAAVAL